MKAIEKKLEDSRVVLQHLEMHLLNTACDDPGATIGMHLALPMLQVWLCVKEVCVCMDACMHVRA